MALLTLSLSPPPTLRPALSVPLSDTGTVLFRKGGSFFHMYTYIFTTGSLPASPPSGTVLLSTRIRYGVISYEQSDARFWNNNRAWRPPDDVVQALRERWASKACATVEFKTDDNGVATPTVKESLADNIWNNCSVS